MSPVPFEPMASLPSTSSSGSPFILIHQSKSAGTSMRTRLFDLFQSSAFAVHGLTTNDTCVPCARYTPSAVEQPCETVHISDCDVLGLWPPNRPLAAVAGHFSLAPTVAGLIARNNLPQNFSVPCLTYVRRPVSRIVSFFYWYRRTYFSNSSFVELHKLSPRDALLAITALGREDPTYPQYGHFPMLVQFGYLPAAAVLNHSMSQLRQAASVAKTELRKCVIGNSDDLVASARLVQHFFPWFGDSVQPSTLPKLNTLSAHLPQLLPVDPSHQHEAGSQAGSHADLLLSNDTVALLEMWYAEEMDVYNTAMELHKQQLSYVRLLSNRSETA